MKRPKSVFHLSSAAINHRAPKLYKEVNKVVSNWRWNHWHHDDALSIRTVLALVPSRGQFVESVSLFQGYNPLTTLWNVWVYYHKVLSCDISSNVCFQQWLSLAKVKEHKSRPQAPRLFASLTRKWQGLKSLPKKSLPPSDIRPLTYKEGWPRMV